MLAVAAVAGGIAAGEYGAGSTVVAQAPASVEQVRLGWVGDTATSITVRWRNTAADATGGVRVRALGAGQSEWTAVDATLLASDPTTGSDFEAQFQGLQPSTEYEYQLAVGAGAWSDSFEFTTAGAAGGDVAAAFVADTGIADRLDGLATGTTEVLDAIRALDPTVVLGGGDYAYYDSDSRYTTQAAAMDAWFRMMQPLTSRIPFMPAYGNHEVLLQERVDDWVSRMATPGGDVGRTSYSFDVDGVHFVSLLAYESMLPPTTLTWLTADLDSAVARGARAIVPYLHRNLYGDGVSHPPSPSLARQLADAFERYDIDVVLTAHDQSFERTFPLTQGQPTTSARRCFTKSDGITWVKTSPGGKLSNISSDFSGYSATPPSPQIAVRDNTMHHFTEVVVRGSEIEVITYGLIGDGSPPIEIDRFVYASQCQPELAFTTLPVHVDAPSPEPVTFDVATSVAGAAITAPGATWVTVSPGTQPGTASVTVDTTALPPGVHSTSLTAELAGYQAATLPVVVEVGVTPPSGSLVAFAGPDRSQPTPIETGELSGPVYIGLIPDSPVVSVTYSIDGQVVRSEDTSPFDLGGGLETATPFDTASLPDGPHVIEASITAIDGSVGTVSASVTTANTASAATAPSNTASSSSPSTSVPLPSGSSAAASDTQPGVVPTLPALSPAGGVSGPESGGAWWSSAWALLAAVVFVGVCGGLIGRLSRTRATPVLASEDELGGGRDPDD